MQLKPLFIHCSFRNGIQIYSSYVISICVTSSRFHQVSNGLLCQNNNRAFNTKGEIWKHFNASIHLMNYTHRKHFNLIQFTCHSIELIIWIHSKCLPIRYIQNISLETEFRLATIFIAKRASSELLYTRNKHYYRLLFWINHAQQFLSCKHLIRSQKRELEHKHISFSACFFLLFWFMKRKLGTHLLADLSIHVNASITVPENTVCSFFFSLSFTHRERESTYLDTIDFSILA